MVLADSNIMIDYFRSRDSDLAKKIDTMDIGLCGAVRAEVIHGARSDYEIDNYLEAFKTFDYLINDDYDWEGTGFILAVALGSNGKLAIQDKKGWKLYSLNPDGTSRKKEKSLELHSDDGTLWYELKK